MTRERATVVPKREYAMRFDSRVPLQVIDAAVAEMNTLVTATVGGMCFFHGMEEEKVGNATILKSHLHADDRAWARFRQRSISLMPLVTHRVKALTGRARSVQNMVPADSHSSC